MKKKKQTTQINLLIRCIVAVYIIYLGHSIIKGLESAPNVKLMVFFAVLFIFAGVLTIGFAVKAFINKEYKDFRSIDDEDDKDNEDVYIRDEDRDNTNSEESLNTDNDPDK
ncbi:MAG: hypothetical protein K6E98_01765 [Lachnospiraceae bacterium]|nr:hypothetical protein [Lachnospiraceae bacterium]